MENGIIQLTDTLSSHDILTLHVLYLKERKSLPSLLKHHYEQYISSLFEPPIVELEADEE